MKKMNPVVHFELPAEDRQRMANFYTSVFGWTAELLGEQMGNYVTVATTKGDQNGNPKERGIINGGLFPRSEGSAQYPSVVIAVDDINESIKKIENTGGKVLGEPVQIPQVGKYVSFIDTENNRNSILQPVMNWNSSNQ